VTLTWTWYLLALHPHIETRLLAELDSVLQGRLPGVADLPHLPYAEKIIKESAAAVSARVGDHARGRARF